MSYIDVNVVVNLRGWKGRENVIIPYVFLWIPDI